MKDLVTLRHLHPVFLKSVPPVSGANLRHRILTGWTDTYLERGPLCWNPPATCRPVKYSGTRRPVFRSPGEFYGRTLQVREGGVASTVPGIWEFAPCPDVALQAHLVSRLGPRQWNT